MKIQLDTTKKTIKVEESVSLLELTDALEKLLPNGEWKEFKLETHTVIQNWSAPIVIRERPYPYWSQPWYQPTIGGSTIKVTSASELSSKQTYGTGTPMLNRGVYNVEV